MVVLEGGGVFLMSEVPLYTATLTPFLIESEVQGLLEISAAGLLAGRATWGREDHVGFLVY